MITHLITAHPALMMRPLVVSVKGSPAEGQTQLIAVLENDTVCSGARQLHKASGSTHVPIRQSGKGDVTSHNASCMHDAVILPATYWSA